MVGRVGLGGVMGFEVRGPAFGGGGGSGGGMSFSFLDFWWRGCLVGVVAVAVVVVVVGGMRGEEEEVGGVGSGFVASGTEKAEPMSERVSERTCMRSAGAMAGMWVVGVEEEEEEVVLLLRVGEGIEVRRASARRSSTIVLSSRIASSTSVLVRRRLPRLDSMWVGSVFDRARAGDGRRPRVERGDERLPWVLERLRDPERRGEGSRWE